MRKLVGCIGVDAGLCWIGDPCYILHTPIPDTLGTNWGEFCDTLYDGGDFLHKSYSYSKNRTNDGLGVVVSTGHGDGVYPVYATIENGRVIKVEVDFAPKDEDEEE